MFKFVKDPAVFVPVIPELEPVLNAACEYTSMLHDRSLLWLKVQANIDSLQHRCGQGTWQVLMRGTPLTKLVESPGRHSKKA